MDMFTGTARVNIPVYTFNKGALSLPISLQYVTGGVRVSKMPTVLGLGWSLNAGGSITRELNDLPDDIAVDVASHTRSGWMTNLNTVESKANAFVIAGGSGNCTDQTTDINYINTNFPITVDEQPDIFDVSAPGLSCQLVYDQNGAVFRPIPYQDIKISYVMGASGGISSFTILNDKGITYTFATVQTATQGTSGTGSVAYLGRTHSEYQYGISFNNQWFLSKMADGNGNEIDLTYTTGNFLNFNTPNNIWVASTTSGSSVMQTLYNTGLSYTMVLLSRISAINTATSGPVDSVHFNYLNASYVPAGKLLTSISLNQNWRTFALTYGGPSGIANFLSTFGEAGCQGGTTAFDAKMYVFGYNGYTGSGISMSGPLLPNAVLDGSQQDAWGYYSPTATSPTQSLYVYPSSFGVERYRLFPDPSASPSYTIPMIPKTVDVLNIAIGNLSSITNPNGGSTSFTYEPKWFLDIPSNSNEMGGGVRVKAITYFDGINTANNIVRNFSYIVPSSGVSTGMCLSFPSLAFTIPYTGSLTGADFWNNSTVRMTGNSSSNECSVVYSTVTEQRTGGGTVTYQYIVPAAYNVSTLPADWTPTMVNTGRTGTAPCPSVGSLANDYNIYPFIPDINYDFERGLLQESIMNDNAGNTVGTTTYTYTRSNPTAIAISGFKYDTNGIARNYGKYQVYANTSELIQSSVSTQFDVNGGATTTNSRSQTTNFTYGSSAHKLPTVVNRVNTDGTSYLTNIKYSKDYPFQPGDIDDASMAAMKAMVTNLNINTPIETYHQISRGSTTSTVDGTVIKYGTVATGLTGTPNIYTPAQTLRFVNPAGATGFVPSFDNGGQFSIFTGYASITNFDKYNRFGGLITSEDNFSNTRTVLLDDNTQLPVATATHAKYTEMAYSNFDGIDPFYGFSYLTTGGVISPNFSHSGINSLQLASTATMSANITLKSGETSYIFSYFINTGSAGSMTISLMNGATVLTSVIVSYGSGTSWGYGEKPISVRGLSGNVTVKVATSALINLDDVLFYPASAEVTTEAYDPKSFNVTSKTGVNGISEYYGYNGFGELAYVYDQDKNIIKRFTYLGPNVGNTSLTGNSVAASNGPVVGVPVTFTGTLGGNCLGGNAYAWNFGDGSTAPSSLNSTTSHTYTVAGPRTVTLTGTNDILTTPVTASTTINVGLSVTICDAGDIGWSGSAPITTTCSAITGILVNKTVFAVTAINGLNSSPSLSYQWQTSTNGTTWTNAATTAQLTEPYSPITQASYSARVIVSDASTGASGTSQPLTIAGH